MHVMNIEKVNRERAREKERERGRERERERARERELRGWAIPMLSSKATKQP